MSDITVYKASAGSGKTYQLTKEYLSLLFKPETNYRNILAVTFTNKATEEMRERIMHNLYLLAEQKDCDYSEYLKQEYHLNDEQLKQKAGFFLNQILYHYSGFNVSTIDSFFQRIVKAFAHEIGLNTGFNVELNVKEVLEEVVSRFFDQLGENKEAKSWLTDYAMSKMESANSWDVQKDLLQFASDAFNESYFALKNTDDQQEYDLAFFKEYQKTLNQHKNNFINELRALGAKGQQIMHKHGLVYADFSYGKSGVGGYLNNLIHVDKKNIKLPAKRVMAAFDSPNGEAGWATAKSTQKAEIMACVSNGLHAVLSEVVEMFGDKYEQYNTAIAILNNINSYALVAELFKMVTKYSNEKNIFLLSLASPFLSKLISEDDAPFVYEKTGEFLKHYMIDEFQDTSTLQWRNFYPLILNGVSEGKRSLVVGDIKQSIYRWRNSNWQLLDNQIDADFSNYAIEHETLAYNWRSSPNVVNFNNWCFNMVGQLGKQIMQSELPENLLTEENNEALNVFDRIYGEAHQNLPDKEYTNDGFVKLQFFEEDKELGKVEPCLEAFTNQLIELKEKGYQPKDIAVLVRYNTEGSLIAKHLMEFRNAHPEYSDFMQFISNDAVFVSSSKVVQLITALLHFFENPNEALYKAKVLYFYYDLLQRNDEINALLAKVNSFSQEEFFYLLPDGFSELWERIGRLPLTDIVQELLSMFVYKSVNAKTILDAQKAFIHSYQDLVLNFTRTKSTDISAFLNWWTEKGESTPINLSEEQNAIRILTIHKSKGLEYKAVFVPFANWKLDQKSTILWSRPPKPFDQINVVPVTYGKNLADSGFKQAYFHERVLAYVDNINLLYVVLTRAKQALFIYAEKPTDDKIKTVSSLLHAFATNANNPFDYTDEEVDLYSLGTLKTLSESEELPSETELAEELILGESKKIGLRLHGVDYYRQDKDGALSQLNYGKLFHNILENISHIEDIDTAFESLINTGVISKEQKVELKDTLLDSMNNEMVKEWFSHKYTVRNEATILLPGGEALRPDRVMFSEEKIIVVDYKFTTGKSKDHIAQVKQYMEVIKKVEELPVEGFVWYVSKQELVGVH